MLTIRKEHESRIFLFFRSVQKEVFDQFFSVTYSTLDRAGLATEADARMTTLKNFTAGLFTRFTVTYFSAPLGALLVRALPWTFFLQHEG
jgi:hypothetical protein